MSTVSFKRSANVNEIPIVDGQLVFDETHNKIYMDNGNERLQYGGDVSLIEDTSYATSNNTFSANGSLDIFTQKLSVIDNKDSALAVTEQHVPVGCLAFQSTIGNADYSGIGNTISDSLVTLKNNLTSAVNSVNNQLSANNNEFYFDYQNGKYGYNTDPNRGADTFNPFNNVSEFVGGCAITNNATTSCHCYPGRYQWQAGGKSFDGYGCGVRIYVNGVNKVNNVHTGDQNIQIMGGTFTVTEEGTMTVQGVGGNNTGMNFISGGVWKLADA